MLWRPALVHFCWIEKKLCKKHLSRVFRIIIIVIVISDVVIMIIIVLAVSSVCQRLPQAQAQARGDCVVFLPGCGHLQVANQMAYDICDPPLWYHVENLLQTWVQSQLKVKLHAKHCGTLKRGKSLRKRQWEKERKKEQNYRLVKCLQGIISIISIIANGPDAGNLCIYQSIAYC